MNRERLMRILPKTFAAAVVTALLTACGGGDDGGSFSAGNTISGTLRVTTGTRLVVRLMNPSLAADIGGLTPAGSGVTVQLVRLDDQGQNPTVLATTTTDASGAYSFTGGSIPAPASNLAVQVVGQSSDMQALVTGSTVDISPASEAVFEEVTANSNVNLTNFTLEELAALNGVVLGTGLDVSNDSFADAVTALKAASGNVLTALVTQFNAADIITDLQNRSYNTVGTLSTLSVSASPSPGIGLASRYGQALIDTTNAMANSSIEAVIAPLTETLNTGGDSLNQGAAGTDVSLEGWIHMPTSTGQLAVSDTSGNGTVGAINAADSFMVYPLTGSTPVSTPYVSLTRGLRIITEGYTPAGPAAGDSSPFANSDLDADGTGTTYHLLQLSQTLAGNSGLHAGSGDQITVGTATGDVTFNSTTGPNIDNQVYGSLAANSLSTDSLTLDLSSSTPSPQTGTDTIAGTSGGYYTVNAFGNLTLRDNASGNPILGVGNVVPGGEIFVLALTPDDKDSAPFPASLNGIGSHALNVAIRNSGAVTLSAGTYNVVKYAYYLRSGTVVGSGYQTGTVAIAADGTLSGGNLIRSEGDISVPAALSDPATALTTSSSTAPESVSSGAITLGGSDNTATLSAAFGGETLTGPGVITADGSIAVFAIDIADNASTPIGRGLLFLIRQP
jgi:hypothetical protein